MIKIVYTFCKVVKIKEALAPLQPSFFEILDESYKHNKGKETHFRLTIG
jgi:stress-induced morphogen